MSATPNLQITEIFCSIQGESALVGWPTVFVRLTGCPLRCQYCDTAYAFHGGRKLALAEALAAVQAHQGIRHVCVTGGEPLAQPASLPLMGALCDAGYVVSLETSGALDISAVDARVQRVLDLKTPGSGEQARNRWSNIDLLQPHDQIKFVLCGRDDFDWAMEQIGTRGLSERCSIFFSPSHEQLGARELADWILEARAPVRLQMQLHKLLWNNQPGH